VHAAEVSAAISALEPFKSGPLEGVRVAPSLYVVKSYALPIAAAGQGRYIVASEAPTATTGRHAGQVRAAWQAQGYAVASVTSETVISAAQRT
jgi:hypothetical protein